jgi:hypothetical protein
MLELLLILAVVVFLVSKLDKHHFEQASQQAGMRPAPGAPKADEAPRPTLRLAIEGTQRPSLRSTGFVKGFGMNPQSVQDIRVYARLGALEHIPSAIVALLQDLYQRGTAVGSEMMELLFHGRALKEGEAIYFALIEATPEPRVVAFIDRLRTA